VQLIRGDGGDAFDLLKVVDVVASHGFDDGPEGHGAAFGVGGAAAAVVVGDGVEVEKIPVAGGLKESKGRGELVGRVAARPGVLIEGLDDSVGLVERGGESLAEAEGKNNLAVGEVGCDIRYAPFAGSGRGIDLPGGQAGGERTNALCCGGQDRNGILAVQELGIRI
jgi:hypothetical protein